MLSNLFGGSNRIEGKGKGYSWVSIRLDSGQWRATITTTKGVKASCIGGNCEQSVRNALTKYNQGIIR